MRDKAKHKSSFYKLLFFHGVALLFLNACSLLPNFEDLTCPNPQPAELEAIQRVFFSPFTQQRFSSESDTVSWKTSDTTLNWPLNPIETVFLE